MNTKLKLMNILVVLTLTISIGVVHSAAESPEIKTIDAHNEMIRFDGAQGSLQSPAMALNPQTLPATALPANAASSVVPTLKASPKKARAKKNGEGHTLGMIATLSVLAGAAGYFWLYSVMSVSPWAGAAITAGALFLILLMSLRGRY